MLATGTPASLTKARGAATLEDAFISYLEEATGSHVSANEVIVASANARGARRYVVDVSWFSLRRLFAYTIRETLELLRDPIRLGFSLFGTTLLMLVFGFGVSTDVNNLSFAVLDHDQTPESRAYLEELRGSAYFVEKPPLGDYQELENRLRSGNIKAAIEIPPAFGRDIKRGRPAWVGAWVDGAMPFRAETIRGYLQAMHQLYLTDPAVKTTEPAAPPPADIEVRFKYNQDFDFIYAMVPADLALMLGLFPAILMALGVVREREMGSITNLYVTPVTRLEFLIGKQIPYVAVAIGNFTLLFLIALFVFQLPLKGSFPALSGGRAALCHRDDRLWHADFSVHKHADRRALRHFDPDRAARDAILWHDDASVVAGRRGPARRPRFPDDLFRAGQRRRFHERLGLS